MALKLSSEHSDKQFWVSNKIWIKIDQFGPEDFRFVCLQMSEQMGGAVPTGTLWVAAIKQPDCDKLVQKTNFLHMEIHQDDPEDKYEIYAFVKSREFSPEYGRYRIEFLCVPNTGRGKNGTFWSKTWVKEWKQKKIKNVIEDVWADLGEPRFRWKTDADPAPEDWWQDRWTDVEWLQKLCNSVKKKTMFAFDIEGLIVKDIKWYDRITGKMEPDRIATGYESHQPIHDNIQSDYHPKLYRKIENPCIEGDFVYSRKKEISKNFRLEIHEDTFRLYHKDLEERRSIFKYNSRLLATNLYNGVILRYTDNLPVLRLLDTIWYGKGNEKEKPDINTYIVTEGHFFISADNSYHDDMGAPVSFNFVLRGIQDILGQELPDDPGQDPGMK